VAGTAALAVNSINIGGNRLVPANTKNAEIAVRETLAGLTVVNLDDRLRGRPRPLSQQEREKLAIDIIETPTRTLDDIVAEVGRPVAVVKMDIECAELLALRGSARLLAGEFGPPPIMTLEYSNLFPTLGGKRSDIFDLLVAAGMRPFRLTRGKSGGGSLLPVPTEADAPDHDDLILLPPGRDLAALLQPRS
jgi:FkbM family methyltransferase